MSDDGWGDDDNSTPGTNTTVPSPIPPWHRPLQSPQVQTCVGNDTISLTMDVTYLNQTVVNPATGPYLLVLPDGLFPRQIKRIYVQGPNQVTTQPFKVQSSNFMGFGWLMFNNTAWSVVLEWDGFKWFVIGGNALQQS